MSAAFDGAADPCLPWSTTRAWMKIERIVMDIKYLILCLKNLIVGLPHHHREVINQHLLTFFIMHSQNSTFDWNIE